MTAIHWLNAINGSFTNSGDWSGGHIPGSSDDAILDAVGSAFTVTSSVSETVSSIQTGVDATLSISGGIFTASQGTGSGANAGVILVGAGATFAVGGLVDNTGTIALGGSKSGTAELSFSTASATLSGGGEILLTGPGYDIVGNSSGHGSSTITNVNNTIVGSGTIGGFGALIVNEAAGVMDAGGGQALVVNSGKSGLENFGLMEATGGGDLKLVGISFDNESGTILAADGSTVEAVKTIITGGTLKSFGSGIILGSRVELSDIINEATIQLNDYCFFGPSLVNNGLISLSHAGLSIGSVSTTLSGNGVIDTTGGVVIFGSGSSLTLASGTIEGDGTLGNGNSSLALSVSAAGVIDGNSTERLVINGPSVIDNAGTLESAGAGIVIEASISNSGLVAAHSGTITVYGSVGGRGSALIDGGTLQFLSTFNESVTFKKRGTLQLGESQAFNKFVKGFSAKGDTTLDLDDIAFVSAAEATFSGTTASGILTVTDGVHTANIKLNGDYLGSTFVASSDSHGGVDVVAISAQTPSAARFVSAMAAISGRSVASGLIDSRTVNDGRQMSLAAPRLALA